MPERVSVPPRMLMWALERSGKSVDELANRFKRLQSWITEDASPTMRQLQDFAQATYTPVGFFFLPEPPVEDLPVPDFRTFRDQRLRTPSADLLDTIYACEQRQEWYRDFAEYQGLDAAPIVGSLELASDPIDAAGQLRDALGFGLARRVEFSSWTQALSGLAEHAEAIGILVMINGVVGSNTHRRLNPEEFRGFALVDDVAPLVFINGADSKAAQIFTLAHELAHIALGSSAVSRPDLAELSSGNDVERWCNEVAAELLVPIDSIRAEYSDSEPLTPELDRLAKFYKVSTLVVLRRVADAGLMAADVYRNAYEAELGRVLDLAAARGDGGNSYNTQPVRVSKTFARAVISDATQGRTLYRDAFRLLGSKRMSAFEELGQRLGVA